MSFAGLAASYATEANAAQAKSAVARKDLHGILVLLLNRVPLLLAHMVGFVLSNDVSLSVKQSGWRREGDSNPRYGD
jgi:hypothetical protein